MKIEMLADRSHKKIDLVGHKNTKMKSSQKAKGRNSEEIKHRKNQFVIIPNIAKHNFFYQVFKFHSE